MPMKTILDRRRGRASRIASATCSTISPCAELALEPGLAGGAELARHGAAGLGGDAHRDPVRIVHQDGLDLGPVMELPQPLDGLSVIGGPPRDLVQGGRQRLGERGAQRGRGDRSSPRAAGPGHGVPPTPGGSGTRARPRGPGRAPHAQVVGAGTSQATEPPGRSVPVPRMAVPAAENQPLVPFTQASSASGTWRSPHSPRSCCTASTRRKIPRIPGWHAESPPPSVLVGSAPPTRSRPSSTNGAALALLAEARGPPGSGAPSG